MGNGRMTDHNSIASALKARIKELSKRAEFIEADLRHPLEADSSEQAVDLADDEVLIGVDEVMRQSCRRQPH